MNTTATHTSPLYNAEYIASRTLTIEYYSPVQFMKQATITSDGSEMLPLSLV